MFSMLRLIMPSQESSNTWILIVLPPRNSISTQQSIPVHMFGIRQLTEVGRDEGVLTFGHSGFKEKKTTLFHGTCKYKHVSINLDSKHRCKIFSRPFIHPLMFGV